MRATDVENPFWREVQKKQAGCVGRLDGALKEWAFGPSQYEHKEMAVAVKHAKRLIELHEAMKVARRRKP